MIGRKWSFWGIFSPFASFGSLSFLLTGQNYCQLLLRLLAKFGGKFWKTFRTQPFSLGWISYCFILFTKKIFRPAQILQLARKGCQGKYKFVQYKIREIVKLQFKVQIMCIHMNGWQTRSNNDNLVIIH